MTTTPNEHGVYTDREELRLFAKRGTIPLCEVRVADTAEGFRATACFAFQTGNWWGSSGPITDRDPPFPKREDAIAHAAGHLQTSDRVVPGVRRAAELPRGLAAEGAPSGRRSR